MLNQKTDEELMLAYRLGDEIAFSDLYNRYAQKVLAFLRLKLREESAAQDVFQSTFLKLHKSKHLYNPSLPFSPWIFTICRNELVDFVRKQKYAFEELKEETVSITTRVIHAEMDLTGLTQEQQTAIRMRYSSDSSFEEIASALNTSPVNARKIISRSLKYLRGYYDKK